MGPTRSLTTTFLALSLAACGSGDTQPNVPDNMKEPVEAKLTSLTLEADLDVLRVGQVVRFTVTGVYDDETTKDHSADVTWTSSDESILAAVPDQVGRFAAEAAGQVTLTATYQEVSESVALSVDPASLESLVMIPAEGDLGMGGFLELTVLGTYSDGRQETLTEMVAWESSNTFVLLASDSERGRLVTFGQGSADITATLDGQSVTGTFTVGPPRVQYIQVESSVSRIGTDPVQLTARGYWTDESATDVTGDVTWSSSDPAVVSVDASGVAAAVGEGEVVITAQAGEIVGQVFLRTLNASVCGSYPTVHSSGIAYNQVVAPMFWLDALDQDGEKVDFRLEDAPCETDQYQTILFVVGAGWCPYCPAFKQRIDGMQEQLAAEGMRVVYIETETDSGAPASNAQAHSIVERYIGDSTNPSVRIGDASVSNGVDRPFSRAVSYLPNALVVRTTDMQVIAAGQNHDFLAIAKDPNRQYGSN